MLALGVCLFDPNLAEALGLSLPSQPLPLYQLRKFPSVQQSVKKVCLLFDVVALLHT